MNQYLTMTLIYIFIIIIVFIWIKFENKDNKISRYEWIILLFSGLGGFALLMTVYYQIENSKKDTFDRNHALTIDKIKAQKDFFMTYINDINLNFPESTQLYLEIFYRKKEMPVNIKNSDSIKKEIVETKICLQMLQAIDDFLYIIEYIDQLTIKKLLSLFLLWFRSNTLKIIFNKNLFMFRDITVDFIKNIIMISNDLDSEINNSSEPIHLLVIKYISRSEDYVNKLKKKRKKEKINLN